MRASSGAQRDAADALEVAAGVLGVRARRSVRIGAMTTYRVGGPAALLARVEGEADLDAVTAAIGASGIEVVVLGAGSNTLVADAGFAGLCVVLGPHYATVELDVESGLVDAGGAAPYPVLARRTAAGGLTGMEWAVGIPGTVGGAVAMNAGGHGAQSADRLVAARVVALRSGEVRELGADALAFGYRRSAIGADELVLSARFRCEAGDLAAASTEIAEIVRWRRTHQPGGRNAGSVFTNPPGQAAGRLVEEAGCRGLRRGSAVVSTKHANFILADPGGAADDVYGLISEVRARVAARLGIELVTELRFVGFDQ